MRLFAVILVENRGGSGNVFDWKGLSLSLNFRYQLGADVFNEALFNKVRISQPRD